MKNNIKISDELLSRFLEGSTNGAEDEQLMELLAENPELIDEMTSIGEASKLADRKPLVQPDLDAAAQQIHTTLTVSPTINVEVAPDRKRRIRLFTSAAAAVAAILLASTIYLVLRPSDSQNNLAQESGSNIDTTTKQSTVEQTYIAQNEESGNSTQQERSAIAGTETPSATENTTPTSGDVYHSAEVEERHYAATQEANSLSMVKPNKSNYLVLCKNLDKAFVFEWNVTNVQQLHFTVKDASGKAVVDVSDPNTKRYELTYRNVYPEKRLNWKLMVEYSDGTNAEQKGQITIDYDLK